MRADRTFKGALMVSLAAHLLLFVTPVLPLKGTMTKGGKALAVVIERRKPLPRPVRRAEVKKEVPKKRVATTPKKKEVSVEPVAMEDILQAPASAQEVTEIRKETSSAFGLFLRYQDLLKKRIEEVKRYPRWARRQGIEGEVLVAFFVLPDGFTQDIRILRSSGSSILDGETIATITRANPFPPPPRGLGPSGVKIEVEIVFKLKRE